MTRSELETPTTGISSKDDGGRGDSAAIAAPQNAWRIRTEWTQARRVARPRTALRDALFVAVVVLSTGCALPKPVDPAPAAQDVPVARRPMSEPVDDVRSPAPCDEIVRIEVWKSARTLRAYCKTGTRVAMDFDAHVDLQVAIGREEIGPKKRAGDNRTPEGLYRIVGDAVTGRFHLYIPIDYPSPEDAETARSEGRLSAADYERLVAAHRLGQPPPADTPLGGDIGFHGEGERWQGDSEHFDWTYGCIALRDEEMDFLAERVRVGVPVRIHP